MGWYRKDDRKPFTTLEALEAWVVGTLLLVACLSGAWYVVRWLA